jgi:hypothetical protein
MDQWTKDVLQLGLGFVAAIGAIVAAWKTFHEVSENRRLRREDLRWRKAQLAREVLEKYAADPLFAAAARMVDWDGREYEIRPGKLERVHWNELPRALRVWDPRGDRFTAKQAYIRDCFDKFFDCLELIEHYLQTELLEFKDVETPIEYYARELRRLSPAVKDFMEAYYQLAVVFLGRFPRVAEPVQPPDGDYETDVIDPPPGLAGPAQSS